LHATENEQLKTQKDVKDKDSILFEWTSALLGEENKTFSRSKRYFSSKYFSFEVLMVVYTYGYALCNLASEKIKLTSNLHDNNSIIDVYQDAALCLRKASGVFSYLANIALPQFVTGQDLNSSQDGLSPITPTYPTHFPSINLKLSFPKNSFSLLPEMDVLCARALLEYSQGIGQVIAIHTAIATGKTSGMIARLSVSVYKLFDQAQHSLIILDNKLKNQNEKNILAGFENMGSIMESEFRLICAQYRILYRGITLYYLALDANQNGYVVL